MAFPASPSNNDVHKEGTRSFVWDSTLGVWDQVRETDRSAGDLNSGSKFPAGHVLQVSAMTPNRTNTASTGAEIATSCVHGITVTSGNDILVTAILPYRMSNPSGGTINYMSAVLTLRHSTTVDGSYSNVATSPTTGCRQRFYIDNVDGTNVPNAFYFDSTITFNYIDEGVSGTTHFYKIFMDGDGGTIEVCYNDTYTTMTLMEIQS